MNFNAEQVNKNNLIYETSSHYEADELLKLGWVLQGVYVRVWSIAERAVAGAGQHVVFPIANSKLAYVLVKESKSLPEK